MPEVILEKTHFALQVKNTKEIQDNGFSAFKPTDTGATVGGYGAIKIIDNIDKTKVKLVGTIKYITSPFSNCQTFCIGSFVYVLSLITKWSSNGFESQVEGINHAKHIISIIRKNTGRKKVLVIDIADQPDKINAMNILFPKEILNSMKYRNTTGNNMIMYIIDVSSII